MLCKLSVNCFYNHVLRERDLCGKKYVCRLHIVKRLDLRAYGLDLGDLSPEQWFVVPANGDFVVELHTRRFGTLTYSRGALSIHGETEPMNVLCVAVSEPV